MSKIVTEFIYPPIPLRNYDWQAYREDYDEGHPVGYGKTEKDAVMALLNQEDDIDDE